MTYFEEQYPKLSFPLGTDQTPGFRDAQRGALFATRSKIGSAIFVMSGGLGPRPFFYDEIEAEQVTTPTRTIGGLPIYWTDKEWVTHSCQRVEAVPGIFLVWTDCGRDVPPNAADTTEPGESVTCAKCLAEALST